MKSTIIIVDTSYLKDLDSVISKEYVESPNMEKTCLTRLCNSLRQGAKVIYIDSRSKRERKVLSRNLGGLLSDLVNLCGIRLLYFKRRVVDVDYVEEIVDRVCRENRWSKTLAMIFAKRFADIGDMCGGRSSNVLTQVVDSDLHIVVASLIYMAHCNDVEVFTSDRKLVDIISATSSDIAQYDNAHSLAVGTTNCLQ